ncbi:MAG TPA: hypothetical protein VHP33_30600 [Polyangiaceae bacterium]|nr:hypothetical protein [Polyangiaceae bacterium]
MRQFGLESVQGDEVSAIFAWGRPRDAVAVTCALFACMPEFRINGTFDKDVILDFTNYAQCAVLDQVFDLKDVDSASTSLTFDLATARPVQANRNTCQNETAAESKHNAGYALGQPKVTNLLVGCWAYGYDRVVAATPLLSVEPRQLPDADNSAPVRDCTGNRGLPCYKGGQLEACGVNNTCNNVPQASVPVLPLVVDTCDVPDRDTDGLNCTPTELGGFGTCVGGACRIACRSRSNCDTLPADTEERRARCCRTPANIAHFLGACWRSNEIPPAVEGQPPQVVREPASVLASNRCAGVHDRQRLVHPPPLQPQSRARADGPHPTRHRRRGGRRLSLLGGR